MDAQPDAITAWQRELERTFTGPNAVFDRVVAITAAELVHEQLVTSKCHGFKAIMDSLQEFSVETFEKAASTPSAPDPIGYPVLTATFRRLRASLNAFWQGYYTEAAASLRAAWENLLFLGTVGHGTLCMQDFFGVAEDIDFENDSPDEIQRNVIEHRRKLSVTIRRTMYGKDSGLSADNQKNVAFFLNLMHAHVHRCESSIVRLVLESQTHQHWPPPWPVLGMNEMTAYTNIAVPTGWAFLRVVSFLPDPKKFDEEWQKRYVILDRSFRFYLEQMTARLHRFDWGAFIRFIDGRFTFPVS